MTRDIKPYTAANRAAWDASAPAHGQSADWARLLEQAAGPGLMRLDPTLTAALRAIGPEGRRAVQVCCNNGRELLSLARLGAVPALGIDQSDGFLAQARQLAAAAGSDCAFLQADIYDLPEDTPRGFDLCLITIGALNWMPDLPGFFRIVAGLLAPGAALVIYETHPILDMFDLDGDTPMVATRSYFDPGPVSFDEIITYDGSDAGKGATSYWFPHTMGAIVSAVAAAGLRIERLEEHPHHNREVEYDLFEGQAAQLPLCYTLTARVPTTG